MVVSDLAKVERVFDEALVRAAVRDIPDYPKPGILFKDITTVLRDSVLFGMVMAELAARAAVLKPNYVVGIEARGFLFGACLADRLGLGFVPVRKKGKLPGKVLAHQYTLEYGEDCVELHEGAIEPGKRVVVVDDLLATGGTAAACVALLRQAGAEVAGLLFMIELDFLEGRKRFDSVAVESLIHY